MTDLRPRIAPGGRSLALALVAIGPLPACESPPDDADSGQADAQGEGADGTGEGEGEEEDEGEGEGEGKTDVGSEAAGEGEGEEEGRGEGDVGSEMLGEGEGEGEEGPGEGEGVGEGGGEEACLDCRRDLVLIPAGEFLMGSPEDEVGRRDNEVLHRVRLTRPFYIRTTEVTQAERQALIGAHPHEGYPADDRPYINVDWFEALAFANELSASEGLELCYERGGAPLRWGDILHCSACVAIDGVEWPAGLDCLGYRLPTEAEWEYAARAGSVTAYPGGNDIEALDEVAWWAGNAPPGAWTLPVAQRAPNAWGLYDMLGNAEEWLWDRYGPYDEAEVAVDPIAMDRGDWRVVRGGTTSSEFWGCRSAFRFFGGPLRRASTHSFRLVRTAPPPPEG